MHFFVNFFAKYFGGNQKNATFASAKTKMDA